VGKSHTRPTHPKTSRLVITVNYSPHDIVLRDLTKTTKADTSKKPEHSIPSILKQRENITHPNNTILLQQKAALFQGDT